MKPALIFIAALVWFLPANAARTQTIPKEILGKWVVSRIIPTDTISCWGDAQAGKLLHTEIEYSPEFFRWKNIVTKNPVVQTKTVTAEQFHDDNSGRGSGSSQVTFRQLGIRASQAMRISIQHPPAQIGGTEEIPGDTVLVKGKNTIIFSVCNVYFEATRISSASEKQQPGHRSSVAPNLKQFHRLL